jgi:hypothetical protein
MPAQASMKVLLASKSAEVTFARELSMLAAVKVYKREAVWLERPIGLVGVTALAAAGEQVLPGPTGSPIV